MKKELKIDLSVYLEIDKDLTEEEIEGIEEELINLLSEGQFEYQIYQSEIREMY